VSETLFELDDTEDKRQLLPDVVAAQRAYNARLMAAAFPQTTEACWLAYYENKAARPVPLYTPFERK
jgi:hypothetical protein